MTRLASILTTLLLSYSLALAANPNAPGQDAADKTYRWNGRDFAFCFISDDGTRANLAWADTATAMDFRFTIAVNVSSNTPPATKMTPQEIHDLYEAGFEIGQHGTSHGMSGLPTSCAVPPRGSWKGYFLCTDRDEATRMQYLKADIERDTIATVCDIPVEDIRTAAYPRHWHGKALIDSLRAEGFIGARTGGLWDYVANSNGEFTTFAANSWDGGISLYRIPLADTETRFFGNHSANPPVHKTREQFIEAAMPFINSFRQSGGIMVMYSHHLGDDNNSMGDINYGSGGVTKENLAWLIDLVRANNGAVMTFSDAINYYRTRSHMVNVYGDLIWTTDASAGADDIPVRFAGLSVAPNPFNPRTEVSFELPSRMSLRVSVHDVAGRTVAILQEGELEAGHHALDWNGRDRCGRELPSGTYVVQMRGAGLSESRRVTLIK